MPLRLQQSARGSTDCLSPLSSPQPASSCSRPRQWKRALKAVCSFSLAAPRTCRRGSKHYAAPSTGATASSEKPSISSSAGWRSSLADALGTEWGLRLGAALFQFWETREYLTEGRGRLEKLLRLEGAKPRNNTRARVLFCAGVLAGEQGDYRSARAFLEESLDISRQMNDKRGVGIALNALAAHARDRGDLAGSRSLFEQNLAVWREIDDRVVVARSLSNLANVVRGQGDYAL